jgi:acyl-CoA thioesterase-1
LTEVGANLRDMIERAQTSGARVILIQMEIPPNYGHAYVNRFRQIFADLGRTTGATVTPFLLDGIALNDQLMQDDGIHPRAAAAPLILDNVWPAIAAMLVRDPD